MTARDWHGALLPTHVCDQLDEIATAMQATIGDPDAAPVRVLLWGPPGVGKTEIMRALSRHLGLYTLSAAPADLNGSMVGQTLIAVKNLFTRARAQAPALLLIDAFDDNFAGDELNARLTERRCQFLIELDGVRQVGAVNIVAEAHDPQKIDRAILARRFRVVEIPLPDDEIRRMFLERALKEYTQRLDPDVDDACAELASLLAGKTCRDLRVLVERVLRRATEQAMQAGRDVDEITLSRDLFFDDQMVIDANPRFASRASTGDEGSPGEGSSLDGLGFLTMESLVPARQFVTMLRNRQRLIDLGFQPPQAVLVCGSTARATTVARAIAQASELAVREHCGSEVLLRECSERGAFRRALADAIAAAPCAVLVSDVERMLPRRGSPNWSRDAEYAVADLWTTFRMHMDTIRRSPDSFVPLLVTSDDLDTLDESIAVRIPLRVWLNAQDDVLPGDIHTVGT